MAIEFHRTTPGPCTNCHCKNSEHSLISADPLPRTTPTTVAARTIVTYIVDRNINYTNVCNVYCKFCAFYRTERDQDHYVLSSDQIDQKLEELAAEGGVQVLLQGGHHPKLGIDFYLDMLRTSGRNIRKSTFMGSVLQSSTTFRRSLGCHCRK